MHDDNRHFLERATTQSSDGFAVSAAALSIDESVEVFGAPLNNVGIQPVWLHIENNSDQPQWLFPIGLDDNYFPPYEAARRMSGFAGVPEQELFQQLTIRHIRHFIAAGEAANGFVYTHSDEGMKSFNVELHGRDKAHNFHFVAPVPGLPSDYFDLDPVRVYDTSEVADLEINGLRNWLETAACCTTDFDGNQGDPLNIVFIGSLERVRGALVSNEWDVTAPVSSGSLWRIMTAFVFGSRYRYAPISSLYLFDREHDLAFQKARTVIDERNHMRLWLAPVTVEGAPVWIGQVSRDVGIKFSGRLWPPTTHIVDPDMDDARFYVLQELVNSGSVGRLAYVKGHEPAGLVDPHRNAEDDPYFTDGLRAVFFLSDAPVARSAINVVDWELPPLMEQFRTLLVAPRLNNAELAN